MTKFWVYGWWFNSWEEAVKKAEAIGKPIKAAFGGTPTSVTLYTPASAGEGTYEGVHA